MFTNLTLNTIVAIILGMGLSTFFVVFSMYLIQLRKNLIQDYNIREQMKDFEVEKIKMECVEKDVLLKQNGDKIRMEEFKCYNDIKIDDSTFNLLDRVLEECVIEYEIYNLIQDKYIFVTDDMEKDMIEGVYTMIKDRISATVMEQLSVIYDAKAIPNIILSRTKMRVLSYKIEKNSTLYKE